jgi:hypothetical protein
MIAVANKRIPVVPDTGNAAGYTQAPLELAIDAHDDVVRKWWRRRG